MSLKRNGVVEIIFHIVMISRDFAENVDGGMSIGPGNVMENAQ